MRVRFPATPIGGNFASASRRHVTIAPSLVAVPDGGARPGCRYVTLMRPARHRSHTADQPCSPSPSRCVRRAARAATLNAPRSSVAKVASDTCKLSTNQYPTVRSRSECVRSFDPIRAHRPSSSYSETAVLRQQTERHCAVQPGKTSQACFDLPKDLARHHRVASRGLSS